MGKQSNEAIRAAADRVRARKAGAMVVVIMMKKKKKKKSCRDRVDVHDVLAAVMLMLMLISRDDIGT